MEREELRETVLQSCLWTFPSPKLPLHRFNLKHYAKELKKKNEERNRPLTRLSTRWDTGRPDLNSTTAAVKTKLTGNINIQFCSVAQLCLTLWFPWNTVHQVSLSITKFWSPLKPMSIESVMPSNLILCCPLILLPSIPPSITVFSHESHHHIRWPKYWSFSFSISLSN